MKKGHLDVLVKIPEKQAYAMLVDLFVAEHCVYIIKYWEREGLIIPDSDMGDSYDSLCVKENERQTILAQHGLRGLEKNEASL